MSNTPPSPMMAVALGVSLILITLFSMSSIGNIGAPDKKIVYTATLTEIEHDSTFWGTVSYYTFDDGHVERSWDITFIDDPIEGKEYNVYSRGEKHDKEALRVLEINYQTSNQENYGPYTKTTEDLIISYDQQFDHLIFDVDFSSYFEVKIYGPENTNTSKLEVEITMFNMTSYETEMLVEKVLSSSGETATYHKEFGYENFPNNVRFEVRLYYIAPNNYDPDSPIVEPLPNIHYRVVSIQD